MQEQVTVIETRDNHAVVRLEKKSECESCGMCLFPKNASSIELRAENKVGAEKGDTVLIEREKDGKFLGALLVFLVPLLLIGVSCVISIFLIKKEIWILLLSLIFIVLWYTILAVIDKKLRSLAGFSPKIVKIIKKGEDENGDSGDNGQI